MPVTTQAIFFPSGPEQLEGYLAQPEGAGPFPALVLIHEIYGLNDNMQDLARRFAEQGYAALAVNLFYGRNQVMCMFRFFGGMLFSALDNGAIRDLKAALNWLTAQPFADSQRVGAVGYCMGGAFAVAWACTDNRLRAIAPHYGSTNPPSEALARLCPVVGSWPQPDFSTAAGKKLDLALDQHNIPHDIKIYPGATHSFANGRPGPANAAASEDAWRRVLDFFREYI